MDDEFRAHMAQVREKNDKFQQRTLESMFDGQRSAAAAAAEAAVDMDIEVCPFLSAIAAKLDTQRTANVQCRRNHWTAVLSAATKPVLNFPGLGFRV